MVEKSNWWKNQNGGKIKMVVAKNMLESILLSIFPYFSMEQKKKEIKKKKKKEKKKKKKKKQLESVFEG